MNRLLCNSSSDWQACRVEDSYDILGSYYDQAPRDMGAWCTVDGPTSLIPPIPHPPLVTLACLTSLPLEDANRSYLASLGVRKV